MSSIRSILRYFRTALWTVRPIGRCYLLLRSSRAVRAVLMRLIRDTTENCKITTTIWKYTTIPSALSRKTIDKNRYGPTFICKGFPLTFLKNFANVIDVRRFSPSDPSCGVRSRWRGWRMFIRELSSVCSTGEQCRRRSFNDQIWLLTRAGR